MKLQEIIEAKGLKILSEKKTKDGSMTILAPFIVAGRMNKNRRLYPLNIVRREVARLQSSIKAGSLLSSADHPYAPHTSLANASHIITKLEIGNDGKGWMEAKILPNEKGKNIMTIIKSGGQLGISARGVGDISPSGIIQNNYKLLGADIVTNPAEPEATLDKSNICESLEFEEENLDKMMGINPNFVEAMIKSVYGMQIDEVSFDGSLEDFKKQKGNLVKAEILVSYDKFETVEEALKHLGADEEIKKISSAPVQKKVTENDVYLEAKMAGVHPKIYADKLNANLDRQEKLESDSDFTVQEVASILEEGRKSGINITDPEERKRILEIAREQKQKPTLTEEEAFIKFAVGKGLKTETAEALWEEKQKEKKPKLASAVKRDHLSEEEAKK